MALGYDQGNPFGDPNHFTRSTGEDEINRFNEWMRTQPFWQQARGTGTGDFNPAQEQQISDGLRSQGVNLPGAFHIDEGGNLNQKSRTKRNLIIAGMIGAGALTAGAGLGAFGAGGAVASGAGAGAGAAGAGAGAAGVGAGTLASTAIGSGFIPAIAGGTGLGALGGGAAAAGLGAAGTLASTTIGSGSVPTIAGGSGISSAAGGGSGIGSMASRIGRVAAGAEDQRAGARVAEGNSNAQYDRSRIDAARLNLQAPEQRASNSVRGDILAGAQPLSINGPISHTGGKMPQISGGLSPALLSDNTRALGKDMSRQALMSQMAGDFQPTPQPHSNGVDTALNTLGTVGATAETLSPVLRRIPRIGGFF